MSKYNKYMKQALLEAKKAYESNEVPIGAVVVYQDTIIGRGYNKRETLQDPLAHAELIAITEASKHLQSWRLEDCDIYVTIEPCQMCSGAIIQSRIKTLIFGAKEYKAGCVSSKVKLFDPGLFNHNVDVVSGVLEEECKELIQSFFQHLRNSKKDID